jgi:hypothetical protein
MPTKYFSAIDGIQYGQEPGSLINPDVAIGQGGPATNATTGFVQLASVAGLPTGVPSGLLAGFVPTIWDSTNNRLMGYVGSLWRGIAAFVGRTYTRPAQQVNATVTLATLTVGATDSSYRISANINVTVSTTVTMTVTCSYTDETNTPRVFTMPFFLLTGISVVSITTAQGNIPYASPTIHIRAKAATTITIATAGTVTAVTYTGEGLIDQVA